MQTQIELAPFRADVEQFTETVFASLIDLSVCPSDEELPRTELRKGEQVANEASSGHQTFRQSRFFPK